LFDFIKEKQPIKATVIKESFPNITTRTLERWIKRLKDEDKIMLVGSKKNWGICSKMNNGENNV